MRGLRFDTDVLNLLPRDGRAVPAFRTFVDAFGSADDLYVLFSAPAGHDISEYDDEIARWSDTLRQMPGVTRVDTGRVDGSRDLTWFADRRLLLAGGRIDEALARFDGEPLRAALRSSRALLSVPAADVTNMVRYDPLGLFAILREELGGTQAGVNLGVIGGGYVSKDGRSRLLIAKPAAPPFDADFSRRLMSALNAVRTRLAANERAGRNQAASAEDDRPPLDVQFAGGHRIAVETESVIRRESILNTFGSLALILPLLYLAFRSTWLVLVGAIPAGLSLLFVLGILGAASTTLSTAATASSAMLFGLGVDGVVLLYVAYTYAVGGGAAPAAAIDALRGPCASMLLGMWTTAATFYGLRFVDFPSLEQLGTLIGHSMVLCGVLTLVLVPALLPRRPPKRPFRSLAMPAFAAWVERRRSGILAAAAVATLVFAAAATRLHINPTLDRLRSVTPGAELLQQIGPMFGLPDDVYVIVAGGPDLEALLAANETLRATLARTIAAMPIQAPSTLLPSAATQHARHEAIRTTGVSAGRAAFALAAAARGEGFREGSFEPFRDRLAALLSPDLRVTYEGYVEHGLGDLIGRFVTKRGDQWLLATYVFPRAEDVGALETVVRTTAPGAMLTGLPLVNRELANRFLPEFVKGLSIGTVLVVALVYLAFRNFRLSMLSLAPTALGLVWAAGALALAGVALDLFALFAVVTFVGIGVDYGVHMVHRYQERGRARDAVSELAPVILVAAAITLLGYGTLVTSSYPPLRSIGIVSVVSVFTLAAASLFVLPAALASARRGDTP